MTKKITNRALLKAGRPRKAVPVDAAATIRAMAATGHSKLGIAEAMGIAPKTLNKMIEANPELQECFDQGREAERHTLHNMLYIQATVHGNASAAMFLLKARHGYREGAEVGESNRVAITFNLPGALQPEQFLTFQ